MRRPLFAAFMASLIFVLSLSSAALIAADVPSPEEVLGFKPGTDRTLADWEAIQNYFGELDRASNRVQVHKIGTSTEGKDIILAIISSEANMARLNMIKEAVRALADPRTLSKEDAVRLAAETPAVVFVGCAQHATEIASTQMSMQAAWQVATDDAPAMETIRRDTVFLLVPSMNPDGNQMVCDWYRQNLDTPFEGSRMPWLYHKYVGHDNNRDWAMMTQVESRHISRILYEEWFPQIVIDVHQMGNRGARMFIPPYHDPINPNLDPLHQYLLALLSARMQLDLSSAGHKGIISNAMFDEWLIGYFTSVPSRHNMVTQLIEMASVNVASPVFQRRSELRVSRAGGDYGARANFPEPWEGGWWRLGDLVAYEHTAVLSVLGHAARNRQDVLENFYRLGVRQIEAGRTEPPFAYLIPPAQDDPATAWEMIEVLQNGGVEVHVAVEAFRADGIDYPAGTQVVLMAQPFRAHAKDLLETQSYPDLRSYPGGPPERPYDVAGWTLSLLMGVKSVEVVNAFDTPLEMAPREQAPPEGSITAINSDGQYLLVERNQNAAFTLVNRLLAEGQSVFTVTREALCAGRSFPAGTFVIHAAGDALAKVEIELSGLGLRAFRVSEAPAEGLEQVKPVRLGVYQPWTASMDEGWTRWVLEKYEFAYTTVHDAEIRAGGLRDRYDAILLADIRASSIVSGNSEGSVPKKYTGGIGEEGIFALRDFARRGGVLIALDSSCEFVIENLELPVKNSVARPERSRYSSMSEISTPQAGGDKRFFCPGSMLSVNLDNTHPLAFGLDRTMAIMHSSSPAFEMVESDDGKKRGRPSGRPDSDAPDASKKSPVVFVGSYPNMNPLISGWIDNHELIHGKGALAEAAFGDGLAVLIGFRCQFRAQARGTFKVLFNAIYRNR